MVKEITSFISVGCAIVALAFLSLTAGCVSTHNISTDPTVVRSERFLHKNKASLDGRKVELIAYARLFNFSEDYLMFNVTYGKVIDRTEIFCTHDFSLDEVLILFIPRNLVNIDEINRLFSNAYEYHKIDVIGHFKKKWRIIIYGRGH